MRAAKWEAAKKIFAEFVPMPVWKKVWQFMGAVWQMLSRKFWHGLNILTIKEI